MWIVSVEINRSVSRHGQTVLRSLPDASTRAFTLQSQPAANRSRPLRTPPDVVSVYRTNPTQWTQCVHGQPAANRSRTVRASGKIVSVYTALDCRLPQSWGPWNDEFKKKNSRDLRQIYRSTWMRSIQNNILFMEYIVHGSKNQIDSNFLTLDRVCWNDERRFNLLLQILITHAIGCLWLDPDKLPECMEQIIVCTKNGFFQNVKFCRWNVLWWHQSKRVTSTLSITAY